MSTRKFEVQRTLPELSALNSIQQKRFAALAGVDEKDIAGKSIAQLSDQFKLQIDPQIFLFKRICGKVVKKDSVTGGEYPVPFATVYVEDTDCNLLLYHPIGHTWSWQFPLFCHRETLTKVQTDACGNFCAWIPRFDIDRILHWRRERHCFPIIYKRPILKDLVERTIWPPVPNPPDPGPIRQFQTLPDAVLNAIGGAKADKLRSKLATTKIAPSLGALVENKDEDLNERLFDYEIPPPFAADFQKALSGTNIIAARGASATDAIRADIAAKLNLSADANELKAFDPAIFRGPFYRCIDVFVPEWQYVFDVPDITFRVTQDTNGDGVEETIYSEGYFDVRWDEENLADIKLIASSIAKESRACGAPAVPCGDVPDLLFAGFMPLRNGAYFNDTTGYALRPNEPIPTGIPGGTQSFPATTPFCGALQLYGCVEVQNAVYYRVHQSTDNGATFSPITGLSWNNYVLPSTPIPIVADAAGWYPVQPINPVTLAAVPRASLEFPNFLLDWPTPYNQKNILKIEIGDASKAHITESSPVTIVTDNSAPDILLTKLAWKYAGEPDSSLRPIANVNCAMIKRGAVAKDIEVVFEVSVSGTHFRDAGLSTSGCGDGSFAAVTEAGFESSHWYQSAIDNSVMLHQRYTLDHNSAPGCYSFSCVANSRTMNPSGADGGNLLPTDWFYNPVYRYSRIDKSVAVVNEDL